MKENKLKTIIESIHEWDIQCFHKINNWTEKKASWLKYYTHVGSLFFWIASYIVTGLISWIIKSPTGWLIVKLSVTNYISIVIILIIKLKIGRIRPCFALNNVNLRENKKLFHGPSLPSGHVQLFFSNSLIITHVLFKSFPQLSIIILLILVASCIILAFSRVFVGVHYPIDTIIAFFSGAVVYLLTIYFFYPLLIQNAIERLELLIHSFTVNAVR
ncbi:MAG: phosphatase PAP2 family protein [Promethearchaeota archaeon]